MHGKVEVLEVLALISNVVSHQKFPLVWYSSSTCLYVRMHGHGIPGDGYILAVVGSLPTGDSKCRLFLYRCHQYVLHLQYCSSIPDYALHYYMRSYIYFNSLLRGSSQ
ncbi:hypothetical protein CRYUN_Cryun25bG0095900 [Craigia yunnanensis]